LLGEEVSVLEVPLLSATLEAAGSTGAAASKQPVVLLLSVSPMMDAQNSVHA
jgi:hypothetical protein